MLPKKRILVIDDELDFVKMLQARLRIEGYEVLVAEDGIKGVQIARREKPDLIVRDIMMPGMDGHTVCDTLKKSTLTWSIPVIYLTAKTGQADELLAMEKGARYYLTKPYNPAMLLEMVKSALATVVQAVDDVSHASIKLISHDDALKDIPLFILAPQTVIDRVDPKTAHLEKFITKPVSYGQLLEILQHAL